MSDMSNTSCRVKGHSEKVTVESSAVPLPRDAFLSFTGSEKNPLWKQIKLLILTHKWNTTIEASQKTFSLSPTQYGYRTGQNTGNWHVDPWSASLLCTKPISQQTHEDENKNMRRVSHVQHGFIVKRVIKTWIWFSPYQMFNSAV